MPTVTAALATISAAVRASLVVRAASPSRAYRGATTRVACDGRAVAARVSAEVKDVWNVVAEAVNAGPPKDALPEAGP